MEQHNKYQYRFLNYRHYDRFREDLQNGLIDDKSIVFVQDPNKLRIWARGQEYVCDDVSSDIQTLNSNLNNSLSTLADLDTRVTSLTSIVNLLQSIQVDTPVGEDDTTLADVLSDLQAQIDDLYTLMNGQQPDTPQPQPTPSTGGTYSSQIRSLNERVTNLEKDAHKVRTMRESSYQSLVEQGRVDPVVYYFTYEGEENVWEFGDEFPVIFENDQWGFGDKLPAIFRSNWAFGGTFPIKLK